MAETRGALTLQSTGLTLAKHASRDNDLAHTLPRGATLRVVSEGPKGCHAVFCRRYYLPASPGVRV
jgi:hypothetical protein